MRRMETIGKLFTAGNSLAVIVPKDIINELKLKKGERIRIFVEKMEK